MSKSKKSPDGERKPINSKLSKDAIKAWHTYAVDKTLTKEAALEEIIHKGVR